ncbi:MAG: glycerate kinase, partial [Actinomycetes bacterium]
MRIVVAPDKYAGTLTATEAAEAIRDGWRQVAPDDELELVPLSDGGPGFLEVLHAGLGGTVHAATVTGPLGDPTPAPVLRVGDSAYVEAAQACGLHLVDGDGRDALRAS